ncbi:MAG: UvrD-helicase domain-containing protein, partial [Thermodesulfobacteriota bacterium]
MEDTAMESLDRAQREALCCGEEYILVAAPPGSGKTRVLASRFARLLNEGVALSKITALTFTEKAAMEMSARVSLATGRDLRAASIGTFHALSLRILKEIDPALRVIGRTGQLEALATLGLKQRKAENTAARISFIKNIGLNMASLEDDFQEIYNQYESYLSERGVLDLDDLITEGARAIEENGLSGADLSHVLVDEYQDINAPQVRLLRALTRGGAHIFAIGDPDQAIYSFRGASLDFFLR